MINESNNKTIRYIASACFVLLAFLIVIRVLRGTWNLKAISLYLFGLIMIAVSMIKLIPLIGAIGSGCCCIVSLFALFSSINQLKSYGWPVIGNIGLHRFLVVIVWILLLIAFLIPKSSKAMGITAGVLGFVATISVLYHDILWGAFKVLSVANDLIPYVAYALFIVGAILIGLSANAYNKNGRQSFSEGNHKDELSDQIDRLTKLKTLLDNGVITQEEFNAKKDEIWDNSVK